MKKIWLISSLLILLLGVIITVSALSGGGYDLSRNVVAGGGRTSNSATYNITGTIGQSVAARSSGGNNDRFVVSSGFWGSGDGIYIGSPRMVFLPFIISD